MPTKKENIQQYYKNKWKDKKIKEQMNKNCSEKFYQRQKQQKLVINKYHAKRKEGTIHRIIDNLASRTKSKIGNNCYGLTHMQMIGCTKSELEIHLENQFVDNMSFDNYGEWEVDHIKPISSYNMNDINKVKECFNYKNLQPLWKTDNQKKSNKIIS